MYVLIVNQKAGTPARRHHPGKLRAGLDQAFLPLLFLLSILAIALMLSQFALGIESLATRTPILLFSHDSFLSKRFVSEAGNLDT
jgi:hypothetical protein